MISCTAVNPSNAILSKSNPDWDDFKRFFGTTYLTRLGIGGSWAIEKNYFGYNLAQSTPEENTRLAKLLI